ncbi:hypothetical protein BC827DRAFT_1156057 [Russula dissimulans]|nr:hypothetical protein BC827DRAFT_1156057 [Russula dissimulans]
MYWVVPIQYGRSIFAIFIYQKSKARSLGSFIGASPTPRPRTNSESRRGRRVPQSWHNPLDVVLPLRSPFLSERGTVNPQPGISVALHWQVNKDGAAAFGQFDGTKFLSCVIKKIVLHGYMRGYVIRRAAWDRELAAEVGVNRTRSLPANADLTSDPIDQKYDRSHDAGCPISPSPKP